MNGLRSDDLEIAGFNGSPLVECDYTLPVARRKSDGMYCVLESVEASATLAWHHEGEAAEFARAGRWTRLREPLSFPRSCLSERDGRLVREPTVVYAAHVVLEEAGRLEWPTAFRGELFLWRRLEGYDDSMQAACGSAETVEALLDEWATGLEQRFNVMYHEGRDMDSLKRVADFMLCAAVSRPIRWQAYLRYAMAQKPDRVRPTFDAFTRNEFPNVSWEGFLDHFKSLREVLKARSVYSPQSSASSSTVATRVKLRGIANQPPINVIKPAA